MYKTGAEFQKAIDGWSLIGRPVGEVVAALVSKEFTCVEAVQKGSSYVCKRRASNFVCAQDQSVLLRLADNGVVKTAEPYEWPNVSIPYTCL